MATLEGLKHSLICHDCGAKPGEIHGPNCDVEHCSVCGSQHIQCGCPDHDPAFARWSGFWPGSLEAKELEMTLNDLYDSGLHKIFFIKPKLP